MDLTHNIQRRRVHWTEHVAVNLATDSAFVLRTSMIPDAIRVTAANTFGGTPDELYDIHSNFSQQQTMCIMNGNNTYNPPSYQLNNSRESYQGSEYSIRVFNVGGTQVTNGYVVLTFEFIRYG